MNKEIIHCDKCESTDVLHEKIPTLPTERHLTMSEYVTYAQAPMISYDMYIYTDYRMICKSCGHIVRYSK